MAMNEADVFATIMAKTVDYYTKAYPAVRHRNEPVTLAQALAEMKDLVSHVLQGGTRDGSQAPKACTRKAEQLSFFVREAKAKYGKGES
jgi:dsDNA-binding SOS-regulon protein